MAATCVSTCVSTRMSTSRPQHAPPPLLPATPGTTPKKSARCITHVCTHVELRVPWSGLTRRLRVQDAWAVGDTGPPAPGRVTPSGPSPTPEGRTPAARTRGPPPPPGCPDPSVAASARRVPAIWGRGPSEGRDQDTVKSSLWLLLKRSLWLLPSALLNPGSPWDPCDLSRGRAPQTSRVWSEGPTLTLLSLGRRRRCSGPGPAGQARDPRRPGLQSAVQRGHVRLGWRVPRWRPRRGAPARGSRGRGRGAAGADSDGCFCLGRLPWLSGSVPAGICSLCLGLSPWQRLFVSMLLCVKF